ncbi:MAG: metallophosphoesterase [Promethearchaeota archaeon]
MKLHILSDLHLEFGDYQLPEVECDFLIIAGDLHLGNRGMDFLLQASRKSRVMYILGNHEFYNHEYRQVVQWWQKFNDFSNTNIPNNPNNPNNPKNPKIIFLQNSTFIQDNVRFLGSTLWTDVNHGNKFDIHNIGAGLSDFHVIQMHEEIFTPEDSIILHTECRKYLETELMRPFQGKTVVITHHMPSYRSITQEYLNDPLNPGFAAHCDDLIKEYQPELWIHGHTHSSLDYWIGDTHIICNPLGYPHERNPEFDPKLIITI